MIPTATVLRRYPSVCEIVFWSNRALGDAWNSIGVECVLLLDAVPVHTGSVERQIVVDVDVKGLSTCKQSLAGKFSRLCRRTSPQQA